MAVLRHARQAAQTVQLAREILFFGEELAVGVVQQGVGVEEDVAVVAVHDHGLAFHGVDRHVLGAHYGGDAQGVGDDGAVGIARAPQGNDAAQLLHRQLRHHRRRHLLGDQHDVRRVVGFPCAHLLQVGEHPLAELAHVRRALAQVGVLHALEVRRLFEGRLLEGALGGLSMLNALADVAGERGVVEHVQIGVEQFLLLRAQGLRHLFVDALDVLPGVLDGALEGGQLEVHVFGFLLRDQLQARHGQHHESRAEADARHAGNAFETPFVAGPAAARHPFPHVAGRFGVGDAAGDLGPQRH